MSKRHSTLVAFALVFGATATERLANANAQLLVEWNKDAHRVACPNTVTALSLPSSVSVSHQTDDQIGFTFGPESSPSGALWVSAGRDAQSLVESWAKAHFLVTHIEGEQKISVTNLKTDQEYGSGQYSVRSAKVNAPEETLRLSFFSETRRGATCSVVAVERISMAPLFTKIIEEHQKLAQLTKPAPIAPKHSGAADFVNIVFQTGRVIDPFLRLIPRTR